jgi:hypothetical protein
VTSKHFLDREGVGGSNPSQVIKKSIDNISYQCFFSSIRELLNLNTKEMEREKMGEHGKNLKNILLKNEKGLLELWVFY